MHYLRTTFINDILAIIALSYDIFEMDEDSKYNLIIYDTPN